MTKLLSTLIVAAVGALSFSAQAASHVGAAPMGASAPMMGKAASAPMGKASDAMMKKSEKKTTKKMEKTTEMTK